MRPRKTFCFNFKIPKFAMLFNLKGLKQLGKLFEQNVREITFIIGSSETKTAFRSVRVTSTLKIAKKFQPNIQRWLVFE